MRASTFTTYLNAQTDPNLEAAWQRNTKYATQSYATITAAAQAATRATAGLTKGAGTAGITNTTRALGQQAQASKALTTASAATERQAARTSMALQREADTARKSTTTHRNLTQSLNTTATAFGVVEGRMSPLAGRLITVARAAEQLTGLQLGLAGVGATLYALGRAGNEYTVLTSRLRPFFDSQKDANNAMADIIGIAQRSRSALEPVVEVYSRLKSNADQLGLSQQRVARLTEFAAKAATLSGGTRSAREGALVQFSQAVGSNFQAGAGQEFNSIQEGAAQIGILLSKYFKNADGSIGTTIGNLKKLSAQGKLTTEQIADAADRAAPALERMFNSMPKTLGTASAELGNAVTVLVGRLDESLGLTRGLAESISLVAANLRVIAALAAGIVTSFALIKAFDLAAGATAATRRFFIMQEAVTQLGVRRAATAAASQAQHAREVAALEAEQIQIRENIALLERQRAVAARDIVRNRPGPGFAGSDRRVAAAAAEERTAIRGLAQERQRLALITAAQTAANGRLAASTTASAVATAAAASRVGLLASVGTRVLGVFKSLIAFLGGPWMVGLSLAAGAVYLLATAQSAAAKAADQMRDAQADLGSYIDRTTGKIIEQNSQLVRNRILQAEDRQKTARAGLVENRKALFDVTTGARLDGSGKLGLTPTGVPSSLTYASATYLGKPNAANLSKLQAEIDKYGKSDPAAARRINDVLTQKIQSEKPLLATNAELEVLRGRGNPELAARAFGEGSLTTSGNRATAGKGRSAAQLEADASARAARTEVQKAQAELAKVKSDRATIIAADGEEAYVERLAQAKTALDAARQSTAALAKQRTAGAAAARKEARDAVQDAKDEAAARRDAATEALLKSHPDTSSKEFLDARLKILATYGEEMDKIDASAAASRAATSQRLADLKKEEDAAPGRGEKRKDILANYDEAPKAIDQAEDRIRQLDRYVDHMVDGIAEVTEANPLGRGLYTDEMAAKDEANIRKGVMKPIEDANTEAARGIEIANLQLQGRDNEAEALRRTLSLVDQLGDKAYDQYENQLRIVRQEEKINDLLNSRSRITSQIQGTVDTARDGFEQFLTDVQDGAGKAAGNLFKTLRDSANKIGARILTERVFAGADAKVRELLTGKADVLGATRQYVEGLDRAKSASEQLGTAFDELRARIDAAGTAGAGGPGGTGIDSNPANAVAQLGAQITAGSAVTAAIATVAGKVAKDSPASADGAEIVVEGQKIATAATKLTKAVNYPSARDVLGATGKQVGENVGKLFNKIFGKKSSSNEGTDSQGNPLGKSTAFGKIGEKIGQGFAGAAVGATTSGIMKSLGIKTSKTGAQIGGAIGSMTGIPGADIIGSIAGGLIGGLFKKTKKGSSTLTVGADGLAEAGAAVGNSTKYKEAAEGLAGGVADQLNSIAGQLGADLGSFSVSIGQRKKKYTVDPTGQNRTKGAGVLKFKDEADAIEAALRDALADGALKGISAASQKILNSGQDLQRALSKALVIESIPKRLLRLTDPVRAAVTELNDEFEDMIAYLKEGGATAEQFADAQKLYDLERAEAIKQASADAAAAINDFLRDITGGSGSPYSKRTTYNNAASELAKFQSDIAGGKVVDQNELLAAARNFQDASRGLYGSSSQFFSDFEMLRSLLEKARDNAGTGTDVSTLPASPFTDTSTAASIAALQNASTAATQEQTASLGSKLDTIAALLASNGTSSGQYISSAIASLPGWAGGAR